MANPRLVFPKSSRLLQSAEYTRVFNDAIIRASHSNLLILARPNLLTHPRLGLVISKKNVRSAVNRNRIKRAIRESFRIKQHNLPPIDAIVLARRGADTLENDTLNNVLNTLWQKLVTKASLITENGC